MQSAHRSDTLTDSSAKLHEHLGHSSEQIQKLKDDRARAGKEMEHLHELRECRISEENWQEEQAKAAKLEATANQFKEESFT